LLAFYEYHAECRSDGTRYRGYRDIYSHGAMNYLTNLKNHLTMNLESFMIRSTFCILPGPVSQRNMGHHRCHHERPHHEDEIEFLDKKTPFWRTNEGSVIRVALDDHRAVLGLANPVEKASDMLKDEKMLPPHPALFRDPELRARTQGRNGARPESR